MITAGRQQRVRRNIEQFAEGLPKKELLLVAVDDLLEEISYLENQKAGTNELERLYLLTQEGFKRMDERFIAMDKRFESLQKQMDERFEAQQKQMDERFIAMDKRFGSLQQQMNSRFSQLQWLIGLLFAGLSLLIGWLGTRQPAIDQAELQKSLTEAVSQGFHNAIQEFKLLPRGK